MIVNGNRDSLSLKQMMCMTCSDEGTVFRTTQWQDTDATRAAVKLHSCCMFMRTLLAMPATPQLCLSYARTVLIAIVVN